MIPRDAYDLRTPPHEPFEPFAHQLPPEGPWKLWVIAGNRGSGKTRAMMEYMAAQARVGVGPILCLVPNAHQMPILMDAARQSGLHGSEARSSTLVTLGTANRLEHYRGGRWYIIGVEDLDAWSFKDWDEVERLLSPNGRIVATASVHTLLEELALGIAAKNPQEGENRLTWAEDSPNKWPATHPQMPRR